MIDVFSLENSFSQTCKSKTREQQTECGDHRHQAEIRRRQNSRENQRSHELDYKDGSLGEYRNPCIADRRPWQMCSFTERSKLPSLIEWPQTCFLPRESHCQAGLAACLEIVSRFRILRNTWCSDKVIRSPAIFGRLISRSDTTTLFG